MASSWALEERNCNVYHDVTARPGQLTPHHHVGALPFRSNERRSPQGRQGADVCFAAEDGASAVTGLHLLCSSISLRLTCGYLIAMLRVLHDNPLDELTVTSRIFSESANNISLSPYVSLVTNSGLCLVALHTAESGLDHDDVT
ncbi:hypothetical protein C0Q70_20925 [Pomacea canaliculata]|uniref:Uncharacterized protein n=1 Tax=Pomacea canaliculata TaxID=400727 RepID=A0A2T7NB26_POMCA|nr:hypothetical protein C0Q70_20925 [Pomacea canaliculata]